MDVEFSAGQIPPLTPEEEAAFAALENLPDSEIDYSDIPPSTEFDFQFAYRPSQMTREEIITAREKHRQARRIRDGRLDDLNCRIIRGVGR